MDAQLSDLVAKEPELILKETELESMRMQLVNQEEQERHSAQVRLQGSLAKHLAPSAVEIGRAGEALGPR